MGRGGCYFNGELSVKRNFSVSEPRNRNSAKCKVLKTIIVHISVSLHVG